ncbi:zinc finger CCCH domain-containing protein 20-like [Senna tora]|uniref:Zinc finger CCCH domain-containing protein 20-like n=1 Tax=Senna tora TaxID=362788 RepID=A0A834T425_9FABA|nr:zinc finger CCCH domain-containing protein 20-like [Senna tora]
MPDTSDVSSGSSSAAATSPKTCAPFNSTSSSSAIKLDKNNYLLWKATIMPQLIGNCLETHVDGTGSIPAKYVGQGETRQPNPAYREWRNQTEKEEECIIPFQIPKSKENVELESDDNGSNPSSSQSQKSSSQRSHGPTDLFHSNEAREFSTSTPARDFSSNSRGISLQSQNLSQPSPICEPAHSSSHISPSHEHSAEAQSHSPAAQVTKHSMSFIRRLNDTFALKDLGPVFYFLGIEVHRDESGFHLCQAKYTLDVLKRFEMSTCAPVSTPMVVGRSFTAKDVYKRPSPCRTFCKHPKSTIMMLGEPHRSNPTVHVPPWPLNLDNSTPEIYSPYPLSDANASTGDYSPIYMQDALTALQRYLPSNDADIDSDPEILGRDSDAPVDAYSCDHFRMYEFKVRRCARGRSHDWTECPYAHPGEKARRRDPRKFHYSGAACPEFRKGSCKKGDACEFAHGVFECWLHPARYRTQPCKDGTSCRRRVCFFAHTPEQLRVLPQQSPRSANSVDSYDGSPLRQAMESCFAKISPPGTPPSESPPLSPMARSLGSSSINEMVASLRNLQLGKGKSLSSSWNVANAPCFGSPRGSMLRPGFCSLPTTPTQAPSRGSPNCFDIWEQGYEEEPAMERVESGRDIRAKMFEKLSKENSLERSGAGASGGAPDVGWVSELVK